MYNYSFVKHFFMFFLQIMHYIQLLVYNYFVSCSFSNVLYIINAYIHLGKALIFLFLYSAAPLSIFQHTFPAYAVGGQRKKQPISLHRETGCSSIFYQYQISAISISVSSFARFSILVTSALAVSTAVRTVTPVSIAFRRMIKPSWLLSAPCAGISMTRSISCPRIRSRRFGDSCSIFLIGSSSSTGQCTQLHPTPSAGLTSDPDA